MAIKTWVGVTVAVAGFLVAGCLTLGGVGIYMFVKHVDIDAASVDAADQTFDDVRARFAGETPLLSLSGRDWSWNRRPEETAVRPDPLHVMAWDADDERLVNVSIPFWLLRLGDDGTVDVNLDGDEDFERLDLTVGDLDRHGPGLIVDYERPGDERVLVWAQ